MVGHTHNDVDQMFSRFSEKLKRTAVYTMEGLARILTSSYTLDNKPVDVILGVDKVLIIRIDDIG
jgi:hypothetical protein